MNVKYIYDVWRCMHMSISTEFINFVLLTV